MCAFAFSLELQLLESESASRSVQFLPPQIQHHLLPRRERAFGFGCDVRRLPYPQCELRTGHQRVLAEFSIWSVAWPKARFKNSCGKCSRMVCRSHEKSSISDNPRPDYEHGGELGRNHGGTQPHEQGPANSTGKCSGSK